MLYLIKFIVFVLQSHVLVSTYKSLYLILQSVIFSTYSYIISYENYMIKKRMPVALQCTLHECAAEEWNIKLSSRFQASWGNTGQQFSCYVNPLDQTKVILTRTSTPLAIHAIFWPTLCLCTGAAIWFGLCVGCWQIEVVQQEYRVHMYGLPTRELNLLH